MKRGFTLIELLVVVLIIGVLSAIALPQYQVAVEKARMTEALQNLSALQRAIDIYIMENGVERIEFLGNAEKSHILAVDLENTLLCNNDICSSKNFIYRAYCLDSGFCQISAFRRDDPINDDGDHYDINWSRDADTGEWVKACDPLMSYARQICKPLWVQGWES